MVTQKHNSLDFIGRSTKRMNLASILNTIHKLIDFVGDYQIHAASHPGKGLDPVDDYTSGMEWKRGRSSRDLGTRKTKQGLCLQNGDYYARISVGSHRLTIKLRTNKLETAINRRRQILEHLEDAEAFAKMAGLQPKPANRKASCNIQKLVFKEISDWWMFRHEIQDQGPFERWDRDLQEPPTRRPNLNLDTPFDKEA